MSKPVANPTTGEYSLLLSSGKLSANHERAIRAIIDTLPERQSTYLTLKLNGRSSRQIAEIFKLKSDSGVRTTIRRAMENVRKRMEE